MEVFDTSYLKCNFFKQFKNLHPSKNKHGIINFVSYENIYGVNINVAKNIYAQKYLFCSICFKEMRNGNTDQELKIIPWKLDAMREWLHKAILFSNKNSAKYKLHPHNTSREASHGNLFLKIHSRQTILTISWQYLM